MNFFDAQDKARRTTPWLIVIYILVDDSLPQQDYVGD